MWPNISITDETFIFHVSLIVSSGQTVDLQGILWFKIDYCNCVRAHIFSNDDFCWPFNDFYKNIVIIHIILQINN